MLGAALLAACATAHAAPHRPLAGIAEMDRQVASVLEHLVGGDTERAAVLAGSLARRFPRFALGQLLHAELAALAALDGTRVGSADAWSPELVDLLLEARARLSAAAPSGPATHATAPATPEPPWPFVQIGPDVEHLVLVDLERSSLALHEVSGGVATRVREHYVSSGSAGFDKHREGDRKTPLGLYRVTRFRSDAALPELYGAGALVLDYPNPRDRARGRTGHGIWLHGVPRDRLSRAPRSSEGCVTMSNDHLSVLADRVAPAGTLVVLTADRAGADAGTGGVSARRDARERYRALFRGWRERRVAAWLDGTGTAGLRLSATELAALADVDENDVTILERTADGRPGAPEVVVMDLRLDAAGETGITLWWAPSPRGDGWTLELAHRRVGNA